MCVCMCGVSGRGEGAFHHLYPKSTSARDLQMESVNRKTEINEMRISKVEVRVEIGSSWTTDHKNKMETPESI